MKVYELIEMLQEEDINREVVIAKDGEETATLPYMECGEAHIKLAQLGLEKLD